VYRDDIAALRRRHDALADEISTVRVHVEGEQVRLASLERELRAVEQTLRWHTPLRRRKLVAILTGVVLLAAAAVAATPRCAMRSSPSDVARIGAHRIRRAAEVHAASLDRCPTVARLVVERELGPELAVDPWNGGYRIVCRDDAVVVTSAGPDGAFDTADDISAPSNPRPKGSKGESR
jgi:hypothetical protein